MAKPRLFSDIKYEELKDFIPPITTNIDIPMMELRNFVNGYNVDYTELTNYILEYYRDVFIKMPVFRSRLAGSNIYTITSISYNTHSTGYDFRINPISVYNNIFKALKLDYEIPFINLDNEHGMDYFKDYVISYIKDIRRVENDVTILRIAEELLCCLDDITNLYFVDINTKIEEKTIPKDALFYLAYRSLNLYRDTNNEKYAVLPFEYYHSISDMTTTPYPHKIELAHYCYKVWFGGFRIEYCNLIGEEYKPDINKFALNDQEVLLAWDILRPGMVERELRDVCERIRSYPNVDYEKYQKLFELKMNYYMNSPYRKYILGKYGLLGYMGFSYDNEYLVFDKFHNSETIDPTKKTILTHGEAIFALPADRFTLVRETKQGIIKARETDDRIKKINHTSNQSFLGRLDNVIYGPNVSTTTFDEELERVKHSILIKKN